jgi:hypothetical protein
MRQIHHFFNIFIGSVISCTATSFIVIHVLATLFEPFLPLKTLDFFIASHPLGAESIAQVSVAFFPNLTQNLMLIHFSKTITHFCDET